MDGIFELVAAYSYAAHAYQAVHGPTAYPKPGTSFILAFQNGLLVMEHQETGVQYYAYCCNTYLRILKGKILPQYAIGDALATHFAHQGETRQLKEGEVFAAVYPNLTVLCYEEDGLEHARIYQEKPLIAMGKLECFSPESEMYLFPTNQHHLNRRGFVKQSQDGHAVTIVDNVISNNKHLIKLWYDGSDEYSFEIHVMIDPKTLP